MRSNRPYVQLDDIQAILNMRDAWKYLLNTISEPLTFEYWRKLNEFIARNEALEWGKLRTGNVAHRGQIICCRFRTEGDNKHIFIFLSKNTTFCRK